MSRSNQIYTYIGVLVFVLLLNFWLPRLLPGGPVDFLTGGTEDGAVFVSEVQREAMLDYYNLNDSLWEQFTSYITGIFTLDFGLSISYKTPVFDVIWVRLPWTLLIVGTATVLSVVIGLFAGLLSAWRHPDKTDRSLFLSMLGLSAIPEFIIGMILLILLAVEFKWLPLGGAETAFLRSPLWFDHVADIIKHMVLPVITLTLSNVASMYLFMRNEAIRVRNEPFIEFASSKGIGGQAVLMRHVARNAALPLVTIIAIRIGGLLAGSVLVETVFSYPGIGKLLQEAILARDLSVAAWFVPNDDCVCAAAELVCRTDIPVS